MYLNDLEQFLNDRNVNGLTSITEDFEGELDFICRRYCYYIEIKRRYAKPVKCF